jgi:hypothetical protein
LPESVKKTPPDGRSTQNGWLSDNPPRERL